LKKKHNEKWKSMNMARQTACTWGKVKVIFQTTSQTDSDTRRFFRP
jgi:hypothetical protein